MPEVLIADDSEFMQNLLREILEEDHEINGQELRKALGALDVERADRTEANVD